MVYWILEINLKSVFDSWREDGFNPARLGEIMGTIADTLMNSDWIFLTEYPFMLGNLIDEIRCAKSMEEFDFLWDDICDLADVEQVWIDT